VSIHPKAIVAATASIPESCNVGPYCTIGPGVELGENCELVSTGHNGASTLWLYSNGADVFAAPEQVVEIWESRPES